MASVRETRPGRFELTIRNKLLPKPVYLTFETREEAETYGQQVDLLLAAGVVPAGLVRVDSQPKPTEKLRYIIGAWMNTGQPAKSDMEILRLLQIELGKVLIADVTYKWAGGQVWGSVGPADGTAPGLRISESTGRPLLRAGGVSITANPPDIDLRDGAFHIIRCALDIASMRLRINVDKGRASQVAVLTAPLPVVDPVVPNALAPILGLQLTSAGAGTYPCLGSTHRTCFSTQERSVFLS